MPIRVNPDGTTTEITDPKELAEIEGVKEKISDLEGKQVKRANEVFSFLAHNPDNDREVEQQEVSFSYKDERTGELLSETFLFTILRLSYRECQQLDAKKFQPSRNGKVDYNGEYAATTGLAWQIHQCIVKDANEGILSDAGKPLAPNWQPLFPLEYVQGKEMMNSRTTRGKALGYALLGAIWQVNEELSFLLQNEAATSLRGEK
jgi:hypothetical protein